MFIKNYFSTMAEKMTSTILSQIKTEKEFENFVKGGQFGDGVAHILADDPENADSFMEEYAKLKKELNPMNTSPEILKIGEVLREMKERDASIEEMREPLTHLMKLKKEIEKTTSYKKWQQLTTICDNYIKLLVQDRDGGSNRAKKAGYTKNAGHNDIPNAPKDEHGNAIGPENDLAEDGGFKGKKILVFNGYPFDGNNGKGPIEALERKGFEVYWITDCSTVRDLTPYCQVWVISSEKKTFSDELLDSIVDFWANGGGLYVLGDNDPFFYDANVLIKKMTERMGYDPDEFDLTLRGNQYGTEVVGLMKEGQIGGLIPGHILSTGLVAVYEGVTVAYVLKRIAKELGFSAVLCEHEGEHIMIYRGAEGDFGPVVIDGAFTKLWVDWEKNKTGSSKLVCNAAAALANPPDLQLTFEQARERVRQMSVQKPLQFNFEGAPKSECAITYDEGVVAVLLGECKVDNTGDGPIDHWGAQGKLNIGSVGRQPINFSLAGSMEEDPFTRRPIKNVVPVVSLALHENRELVEQILCEVLMNGVNLPRVALYIWCATTNELYIQGGEHSDVWKYLTCEVLEHVRSTPDFLPPVKGVPDVPLIVALHRMFHSSSDMDTIRRSFGHVVNCMSLLHTGRQIPDCSPLDLAKMRNHIRHALIKLLVEYVRRNGAEALPSILYESSLGIPTVGKIVDLNDITFLNNLPQTCSYVDRATSTLRIKKIMSKEQFTILIDGLSRLTYSERAVKGELLILNLLEQPWFAKVWNGKEITRKAIHDQYGLRNKQYHQTDDVHYQPPPFATTYGPPIDQCTCDFKFGDTVESIKKKRAEHFQKVYGTGKSGYPTNPYGQQTSVFSKPTTTGKKGSASFSLHRAIQKVMVQSPDQTIVTDDKIQRVAGILKHSPGNIYRSDLPEQIRRVMESYCECAKFEKKHGLPLPTGERNLSLKDQMTRSKAVQKLRG